MLRQDESNRHSPYLVEPVVGEGDVRPLVFLKVITQHGRFTSNIIRERGEGDLQLLVHCALHSLGDQRRVSEEMVQAFGVVTENIPQLVGHTSGDDLKNRRGGTLNHNKVVLRE